jgi:hypothetical protein
MRVRNERIKPHCLDEKITEILRQNSTRAIHSATISHGVIWDQVKGSKLTRQDLALIAFLPYYLSCYKNYVYYVRRDVLTAVTMKNAVFWDIKTQFVPHMKHITSPLQSPAG